MLTKIEYSGYFYKDLPKLLIVKDNFTLGEKLTQIERTANKRFINMTDEEIYDALKKTVDTKDYYLDEQPDEVFWVEFLK